jgi:hypothetical protein
MTDDTPESRRRGFRVVPGGAEPRRPALPAANHSAGGPGPIRETIDETGPFVQASSVSPERGRALAPGAPPSPGTAPLEIARHLRMGEALVWWDAKVGFDLRPLAWIGAACTLVLLVASLLAPELWSEPLSDLWKPIAVLLSPMLLWLVREQLSQRSILVTDTAIVEVPRRGEPQRLQFTAVQRVRRDLLTGGVVLVGKSSKVRIPASLVESARAAVASQRRSALRHPAEQADDPVGFMRP